MAIASSRVLDLKAGEWVWVRSMDEIMATLDKNGRFEELPFMPQMLKYCGQKLRVARRAHKVCGTQHATVSGSMNDAVVIEDLRCDGQGYGGCEMSCLFHLERGVANSGKWCHHGLHPIATYRPWLY